MSQFNLNPLITMTTGATTLADKQYTFVKQHTDGTAIPAAAATDAIVGIVVNEPTVGQSAAIQVFGTAKVKAGGTIAVGAWVTSNASGLAVATTTAGNVVMGQYLGPAAAATGDIIEITMTKFVL